MSTRLRNVALISAIPVLLGIAVAIGKAATRPVQTWTKVEVGLPVSEAVFPPGNGADIANGQCLICHSAGMVLRQPPLTLDEWTGEINKMRNSFGAPLPADQVGVLARYLVGINGRQQSPKGPAAVDGQGS